MKKLFVLFFVFMAVSLHADLKWNLPEGWVDTGKKSSMRLATLGVKDKKDVEISVTRVPGDVGGELANVNRWRRQMGLAPVKAEDLQKEFEVIETKVGKAKLVDLNSGDKQMVAVMLPYKENTYFFKMMGSKESIGSQKENLVKLIKSLN